MAVHAWSPDIRRQRHTDPESLLASQHNWNSRLPVQKEALPRAIRQGLTEIAT